MHVTGREVRKAVKVIDGTLNDYLERLDRWTSQQGWLASLAQIEPSAKFHGGVAQAISGCTLITPTYQDSDGAHLFFSQLNTARAAILDCIDICCNLVPTACLHVTVADLISGAHFEARCAAQPNLEARLRARIETILAEQPMSDAPLEWRVSGLAFFKSALVAVLTPASERDYEPIRRLRDTIYGDDRIIDLGVKRPLPFLAHVTLAYYEDVPALDVRKGWIEKYKALQAELRQVNGSFIIEQLDLRWFQDMTCYHRYTPNVGIRFGADV